MWRKLNHQTISPAILLAGESLDHCDEGGIRFGGQDAGASSEFCLGHPNLGIWIGSQVSHPLGSWILGDDVIAAIVLGKPDFDFAGKPALAATGGQVEERFAIRGALVRWLYWHYHRGAR